MISGLFIIQTLNSEVAIYESRSPDTHSPDQYSSRIAFHPHAGYAELQRPTGLDSNHFNFHITRLIGLGFVEKLERGRYRLTPKGKEYANRLDTENNTMERQPKVAVLLAVERSVKNRREFLFQQRLKNPYYGFWGLATGKIRWGETIAQAAERELMEETGLRAEWRIAGVYHELVTHTDTNDLVEDKIFFAAHGINPIGTLLVDFEGGHNEWLTKDEAFAKEKKFDSFKTEIETIDSSIWLHEHHLTYDTQAF